MATTESEMNYEQFLALERERYKDGHVTEEERAAYERELRLLRAFPLSEHVAPNAANGEEARR
ncbi:hypothetical protein PA598K_03707 [Paenibacillus sp. 598K]|uniref:hypothetical protein n=1 Tax=Paenibacillus sp. 598K TaxID=1117987 RepID=UPI000FF9ED69|nr:hypothetical protein [Paenibacillus sp. 598K]GBF75309.1 hypothetical protein PA598K_03707 [Paenibacillus sp. 598K]